MNYKLRILLTVHLRTSINVRQCIENDKRVCHYLKFEWYSFVEFYYIFANTLSFRYYSFVKNLNPFVHDLEWYKDFWVSSSVRTSTTRAEAVVSSAFLLPIWTRICIRDLEEYVFRNLSFSNISNIKHYKYKKKHKTIKWSYSLSF